MDHDSTLRAVVIVVMLLLFPFGLYHRFRSHSTGENLDRRQEGLFTLATLLVVAISLIAANWFLLAAGVALLSILIVRTRTEEQNLVARFGDSYQRYMERTGRFVPRLNP